MHRLGVASAVLGLALVAGCSQGSTGTTAGSASPATGKVEQAAGAKPAPFDKGPVKIAMVRQSGAGDYFQQWGNGASQQAKALGIEMQVYDAQADNAKQSTDMQTAMSSGVSAIIVDHGLADTMNPLIDQAIAKKIPVIIYDVTVTNKEAVVTHQSDADMATKTLELMAKDVGAGAPVGYVNVFGIAPLDRRNTVFEKFVKDNKWNREFFVGKFTNAVATDNAQLVDAALKAHPNVKAIFAPYDELSKGTVSAVLGNNLGSKIKVYGIDISNADIEVMTKAGSPWVATAATDPAAVGAAVVRAAALKLAGQLPQNDVTFPATLITQQFLIDNKIANMATLRTKLPDLGLLDVNAADWIPKVSF
jgi:simple sugar transport system substrate-binding protein